MVFGDSSNDIFSPDTLGRRVAPIRRNTSPSTESCETSLNFSLQLRRWIDEKGKVEPLHQAGTFGWLHGQTDTAAGQRRKAIAIPAAHSVTGGKRLCLRAGRRLSHRLVFTHCTFGDTSQSRGKRRESINERV